MPKEQTPGRPTTRRYSPEERVQAVRLVRQLGVELGTEQGPVQRIASQLGSLILLAPTVIGPEARNGRELEAHTGPTASDGACT